METGNLLALSMGAVVIALCGGMAAAVLASAPRRGINRWLAAYLVVSGLLDATDLLATFAQDRWLAYNGAVWNYALVPPTLAAYLLFVGLAVASPLARPLALRPVRLALAAVGVLGWAAILASHARVFGGAPPAQGGWVFPPAPAFAGAVAAIGIAALLLGLAAGLDAWRRAPRGSVARERAGAYALAFGVQDAGYGVLNGLIAIPSLPASVALGLHLAGAGLLLVVLALLARALLRHQLFDFDLKVKRGLARGVVAAAFVAAFFIASEGAQQLLSDQLGPLVGLFAAGLLVFALAPLQRLAERVSDAAMPRVTGSPEYVAYRKLQVYRATLESALADGEVTPRERAVLERLRKELGVVEEDAVAIEADVAAARGA
ncbi:MAG TPA: hypothetical protein VHH36_06170 [Candidatus Thermoplasmatota archaeon]|nr:hypothetical protein [Candidatus Thermoplasmatota archaeon]